MKILEVMETDEQFKQAMENIVRRCSLSIHAFRKTQKLLYRGFKGESNLAFMRESPINRRPKDVPMNVQTFVDMRLAENGFKALRSNSIFCTSDYGQATFYGNVYVIFPIDNFANITWSSKFHDLVEFAGRYDNLFDIPENRFIDELGYKKNDLQSALLNKNEIMLHGKYIAASWDAYSDKIKKYLDIK